MFYVYCIQSEKHKRIYTGFTDNLKRRYKEHNDRTGGDYTAKNGPWKLIFYEAHINETDAREMEKFYKTGYGREVLKKKLNNYLAK